MLLHEEDAGTRRMHGDMMNAMADLCRWIGNVLGAKSLIDGLPALAAVVSAEGACGGDGDVHPLGVGRIQNNGVQAQATCARLPVGPGAVAAKSGEFFPILSTVG